MGDDGRRRTASSSIVVEDLDRGDPVARSCRDEHKGDCDCQDGAFHELTSPILAGWFRPHGSIKEPVLAVLGLPTGSFRHPNGEPTLVSRWRPGKL